MTAAAIGYEALVAGLQVAAQEFASGRIQSPARIGVALRGEGVCLSMPASAEDICIHKLVTMQPANKDRGLPTIQGVVTVCDARTGSPVCFLDGPELTGRRTAAISMLGIRTFLRRPPRAVLLIGTGIQSTHHALALQALYPETAILVRGKDRAAEEAFCAARGPARCAMAPCPEQIPDAAEVVITLTTSKSIVYDEEARPDRLVIGVGAFRPDMAEIGPRTLAGSRIYADDPGGARHEAGDLIRAGVDWSAVGDLCDGFSARDAAAPAPVVLKSVGTAAWDLAAARVALRSLAERK